MWKIKSSRSASDVAKSDVEAAYDDLMKRSDLGFLNLQKFDESIAEVENAISFFSDTTDLVVIGLGGSSLGAKALTQGLVASTDRGKLHFLDNVDSYSLDQWLSSLDDPKSVGWLVCSKSGSTIESLALYDYCRQAFYQLHGFTIEKQTMIVSEQKASSLTSFAQSQGCPQLTIPDDIGGRFSVFTPVGLLPARFCGLDLKHLKHGYELALGEKDRLLHSVSQLWNSQLNNEHVLYSFQYTDRLQAFGLWLQQLWSESLGKALTRSGEPAAQVATFVTCRGASDQHSVLQQIIEGPEKKAVIFHRVESSEQGQWIIEESCFTGSQMVGRRLGELLGIEAEATELAIQQSQGGTMVLKTEKLSETTLAYLMMHWMLSVGIMAELLDVDGFNQPGVESGKAITRRVLSRPN